MSVTDRSAGDARLSLVVSWAATLLLALHGVLTMVLQETDELTTPTRTIGVVCTLIASVTFWRAQLTALRGERPAPWMVAVVLLSAGGGFVVAAWLNGAFAFGVLGFVLAGRRLVLASAAYAVVLGASIVAQGVVLVEAMFFLLTVATIGIMLYVLTRLAVTVGELARARESLARMQVDEERHRINRDLHDILGRSLVAVGLRVQTAIRLLETDTGRCGEQLDEVARMVVDGQAQLRGLTRGETVLGFTEELAAARDLFARLGVRCSADVTAERAAGPVLDGLGSRVLRETVTNLLKHARPTWVEISLRSEGSTWVLVVVNDGALDTGPSRGTGLADLAVRAEQVGGALEAALIPGSRFRVITRLPEAPAAAGPAPSPPSSHPESVEVR